MLDWRRDRILWWAIDNNGGRSIIMAGDRILWWAIDNNGGRSNSVVGDRILWWAIDNSCTTAVYDSVGVSTIDCERWGDRAI
ncbi:hypothetical protein [Microcoleus sp. F4-D5]|uniref:hypothetical protein n=1 Tax=Microcoleus sp. F4-D5 TaxID=2818760 RepID=UPI002FCF6ECD